MTNSERDDLARLLADDTFLTQLSQGVDPSDGSDPLATLLLGLREEVAAPAPRPVGYATSRPRWRSVGTNAMVGLSAAAVASVLILGGGAALRSAPDDSPLASLTAAMFPQGAFNAVREALGGKPGPTPLSPPTSEATSERTTSETSAEETTAETTETTERTTAETTDPAEVSSSPPSSPSPSATSQTPPVPSGALTAASSVAPAAAAPSVVAPAASTAAAPGTSAAAGEAPGTTTGPAQSSQAATSGGASSTQPPASATFYPEPGAPRPPLATSPSLPLITVNPHSPLAALYGN